MKRKLKVTKTSMAVLPNVKPREETHYYDLKESSYANAGIEFDIVEIGENYVVLNIYFGTFYENGFRQYVFDDYYPITLEKKLEGTYSKYTFELVLY